MHTETTTPPASPDVPAIDRWRWWLGISFGVCLGSLLFYSALICGCHFHLIAVPVGLVPVVWGGFTLVTYHTFGERILGYLNTVLAFGWLYLTWHSNLKFAF